MHDNYKNNTVVIIVDSSFSVSRFIGGHQRGAIQIITSDPAIGIELNYIKIVRSLTKTYTSVIYRVSKQHNLSFI